MGTPTKSSSACSRCGAGISAPIEPESTCPSCSSDLHTCTNCRHFDTSVANECREPTAERVARKARRNTCDLFAPKIVKEFESDSGGGSDDPKAAFDALFDL